MFYDYYNLCLENEIWKDVIEWEEFYQVSNLGRIRAKERTLIYLDGSIARRISEKIRKPKLNKHTGYLMVGLNGKGKTQNVTVHSIVAKAFIENYESFGIGRGKCTNHKDGNKLNNNLENLEVISVKENIKHMFENGLNPSVHSVEYEGIFYYSKAEMRRKLKMSERKQNKLIESGLIKVL